MADRIRTVKASGGDYSSLAAWEAGEQADLVSLDETRIADCSSLADTSAVSVTGWTTDATRRIVIRAASGERHGGKWNTSAYRLSVDNNNAVALTEEFVDIQGIQAEVSESGATQRACFVLTSGLNLSDIRLEKCIARQKPGSAGSGNLIGFQNEDSSTVWRLSNCLAYDFRQGSGVGFNTVVNAETYHYFCGAHNCDTGFQNATGADTMLVKTSWAQDCTDGFAGTWDTGSDYNISDVASDAPGANSQNSTSITFVDEANDDFHMDPGSAGVGDGIDLSTDSAYPVGEDIDYLAFASWDGVNVGPDQFAVSGGALSGTASGTTTGVGTLAGAGALVGTASATSSASGVLNGSGALSGNSSADTTASGTLAGAGALSGQGSGSGDGSGTLSGAGVLSGSASATSDASGTLAGSGALAGSSSGAGDGSGNIQGVGSLSGIASAEGTASGNLVNATPDGSMSGTASATTTGSGNLVGAGVLIGSASAEGFASGTIRDLNAASLTIYGILFASRAAANPSVNSQSAAVSAVIGQILHNVKVTSQ
jgi:hypothetical protein